MDRDLRLSHAERVLVGYPLLVRAAVLPEPLPEMADLKTAEVLPMKCSAAACTRPLSGTVVHENAAPRVPGQLKVYHLQCWLQERKKRSRSSMEKGGAPPAIREGDQADPPRPVRLRTPRSGRRDRELWERWYVEKEGSA